MGLLFFAISWANSIDLFDNVQQFYIPVTRNHQGIISGHIVVKERPSREEMIEQVCHGHIVVKFLTFCVVTDLRKMLKCYYNILAFCFLTKHASQI